VGVTDTMDKTFKFIRVAVCAVIIAITVAPVFDESSTLGLAMILPVYVAIILIEVALFVYFLIAALRKR
jgi:hypothetical protein